MGLGFFWSTSVFAGVLALASALTSFSVSLLMVNGHQEEGIRKWRLVAASTCLTIGVALCVYRVGIESTNLVLRAASFAAALAFSAVILIPEPGRNISINSKYSYRMLLVLAVLGAEVVASIVEIQWLKVLPYWSMLLITSLWLYLVISILKLEQCQREVAHSPSESPKEVTSIDSAIAQARQEAKVHAARVQAEQHALRQREFLATMSHELRTPLSCIVGISRIWGQSLDQPESIRRDMGTIERTAVQLLRMVDDGLSFVRQDGAVHEPDSARVKMGHLIRDMYSIAKWLAQQNGNRLEVIRIQNIPGELYFDERRMRQVLINLLSNAARFTQHGCISIGVGMKHQGSKSYLNWVVRDTGRGMSAQEQERFFEPWAKSRDSQGLGLGLALVRRLVAEMQGQIDMESQVGKGAQFAILIPVELHPASTLGDVKEILTQRDREQRGGGNSAPMELLTSEDQRALDFTRLRVHLKLGQLSEIDSWLHQARVASISAHASRVLEKLEAAYQRVDLDAMQQLIDQFDAPLSFV